MDIWNDPRIVLTLDAGGTNFVFGAIRGGKEAVSPLTRPACATELDACLNAIRDGFRQVMAMLPASPSAISFAFPGPADYPEGIIGDLFNLPCFRGGIPLGPCLEELFGIPVFINNDGDLFVYGEAIGGFLPWVNRLLVEAGSPKRYRNLFGITLGTGFGAGIVRDGRLYLGDNSVAGEIWLLRNRLNPDTNAEEGASIRAIQREYTRAGGLETGTAPSPKEIFEIAQGMGPGQPEAAREAYRRMARVAGDALGNALTLLDGLAVIGGGIAGAHPLFMPFLLEELGSRYTNARGETYPRLVQKVYNLEDAGQRAAFVRGRVRTVAVPGSNRTITYDPEKRIGIGISRLGTSQATALGAYAFALQQLSSAG